MKPEFLWGIAGFVVIEQQHGCYVKSAGKQPSIILKRSPLLVHGNLSNRKFQSSDDEEQKQRENLKEWQMEAQERRKKYLNLALSCLIEYFFKFLKGSTESMFNQQQYSWYFSRSVEFVCLCVSVWFIRDINLFALTSYMQILPSLSLYWYFATYDGNFCYFFVRCVFLGGLKFRVKVKCRNQAFNQIRQNICVKSSWIKLNWIYKNLTILTLQ